MRDESKQNNTRVRHLLARNLILLTVLVTAGCGVETPHPSAQPLVPLEPSATAPARKPESPTPSTTSSPRPTLTEQVITLAGPLNPESVASTCPADRNIVHNGRFDSGVSGWQVRYGRLYHTTKTYVSPEGASVLVTSEAQSRGGFMAVMGHCIDRNTLGPEWGASSGVPTMQFEAYLQGDTQIEGVSISVFFHRQARCRGEIIDVALPPAVQGGSGWMHISQSVTIPDDASSLDFVISASGQDAGSRVAVDDVCGYRLETDAEQDS